MAATLLRIPNSECGDILANLPFEDLQRTRLVSQTANDLAASLVRRVPALRKDADYRDFVKRWTEGELREVSPPQELAKEEDF